MVCTRCPEGGVGDPPCHIVDSVTLTCLFTFSIFQHIAVSLCPIKWIDRLYYLVLPKPTLTKTNKWLKKIPPNKLRTADSTNNVSTSKQENVRISTSPTLSSSLQGEDNANLIRSEKNLGGRGINRLRLPRRLFEIQIYIHYY